jgi:hypothetical protein
VDGNGWSPSPDVARKPEAPPGSRGIVAPAAVTGVEDYSTAGGEKTVDEPPLSLGRICKPHPRWAPGNFVKCFTKWISGFCEAETAQAEPLTREAGRS